MNSWLRVCSLEQVPVERGVAVLVEGEQVALFRTADDELHAVDNLCPFSGAMVISRGIVGSRGDTPTVASPVYKQVFDLTTGACFDDAEVSLAVHAVRVLDGDVHVSVPVQERRLA
jgi:nitrite reductase (NADH) small subunit